MPGEGLVIGFQPELVDSFTTVAVVGGGEIEKFYTVGKLVGGGGGEGITVDGHDEEFPAGGIAEMAGEMLGGLEVAVGPKGFMAHEVDKEGGAAVAAGGGGDCEFGGFAVVGGDSHDGRVVVKQEMVVLGVGEPAEELFGERRDPVVAGGSIEDCVNGGELVGVKFACDGEFHAFQA